MIPLGEILAGMEQKARGTNCTVQRIVDDSVMNRSLSNSEHTKAPLFP